MSRYRLHSPDGDDLGEVTYAQMIYRTRRSSPATISATASSMCAVRGGGRVAVSSGLLQVEPA
jgi:hypothetical protein